MKRTAFLILLAAIFLSSGLSPVVAAEILKGIKGKDDRLTMVSGEFPWSAIGRVNTETGGHCTGVMVGPALVITAAHCFYDKRKKWYVPADHVHFVAGYRDGKYVAHTTAKSYFLPPGYDAEVPSTADTAVHDWAFIVLKEDIGIETGWFGVANFGRKGLKKHKERRTPFIQAGYSRDKKKELTSHIGCTMEDYAKGHNLLVHRCDAVPGDSGSPIFIFKEGLPYLTSIHVATTKITKPVRGVSVPTETFVRGVWEKGAGKPQLPRSDALLPRETLRTLLATMGYTGGGKLEDAIRRFQADEGLTVTGEVTYDLVGYLVTALVRTP